MLRDKVIKELKTQGREYEDIDDIMKVFRENQLTALVENGWDLWDLDEWVAMEKLIGVELNENDALKVMKVYWDKDIVIADLPYSN